MFAQDIEIYLADLGQELLSLGVQQPIRILVVGGAFMLTQVRNRPSTQDVDVLLKDIADPSASPVYQTLKTAVRTVASRHQLSPQGYARYSGARSEIEHTDARPGAASAGSLHP
jgi:hypothetical protein